MSRLFAILICVLAASVVSPAQTADATAHIGKGYELVQSQRFIEAAEEFRAALQLAPDEVSARYQLAVCLFALGDRDQSRQEFERVRTATKDDPAVTYYLARLDLLAGDNGQAIRRLESVAAAPPFPDTAFYLGSAYLAVGRLANATKWLRKAAQADPRDFRVHYRLARALHQAGERQESEKEYALSTELRERYNETARQSVACAQALHTQPIAEARALCNRIFDPNDPDKLTMLGMLYGENGKFEEAIEPLKRAAELDPDSFEIFHNLGLTYFRLRRYSEARAPLEKAVSLRPDFVGSNAILGATLYSLQDDDAAYRVLDFAHRLKPGDADTAELLFRETVILGDKRVAAGDYSDALRYFEKGAALHPANPQLQQRIAEIKTLLVGPSERR